ncbi:MAG TPA: PIN domain-containing protein [Candidatus Lokiarchaeia archaeon]|nr:PIN domain-containing protein [Candidatus Lokiarchaeia archaeon]
MSERAFLDTGVITLYYSEKVPTKVDELFNKIKSQEIEAYVINAVIVEAYYNTCKMKGKERAENIINNFTKNIPYILVQLDRSAEFKAGALKCEFRKKLSYADCMSIAVALQLNATFHTTEKDLPSIARLKIMKYGF